MSTPNQQPSIPQQSTPPEEYPPQDYQNLNQQLPPLIQEQNFSQQFNANSQPSDHNAKTQDITLKIWQFILILVGVLLTGALISFASIYPSVLSARSSLTEETTRADKAEKKLKALTELNKLYEDSTNEDSEDESNDGSTDSQNVNGVAGDTESSGTLSMTFTSYKQPKSVEQQWNGNQPALKPKSGTKFISVAVKVKNDGKSPIDLTCGYPLEILAMNEDDQQYTPIEDLYKIPGNPECNAQLQPGMSAPITYVFNVPSEAEMIGFAWRDTTDFNTEAEYATFVFKDGYTLQ